MPGTNTYCEPRPGLVWGLSEISYSLANDYTGPMKGENSTGEN